MRDIIFNKLVENNNVLEKKTYRILCCFIRKGTKSVPASPGEHLNNDDWILVQELQEEEGFYIDRAYTRFRFKEIKEDL